MCYLNGDYRELHLFLLLLRRVFGCSNYNIIDDWAIEMFKEFFFYESCICGSDLKNLLDLLDDVTNVLTILLYQIPMDVKN